MSRCHSVGWVLSVAIALLSVSGCAKEIPEPGGQAIDFSSPKNVVSHIFWAARTGTDSGLASLCDSNFGNPSVKRICAVRKSSPDWESFRENFARGTLNGEPRIAGDRAVLKFHYGPDGATPQTMTLERRDKKWFLKSF